jgi:hypothetical protein
LKILSRLVPGLRVALTRLATKVAAFSRSDTVSLDAGLPTFTTIKSGRGVETLRSFGLVFSKRRARAFLALEELDFDDVFLICSYSYEIPKTA